MKKIIYASFAVALLTACSSGVSEEAQAELDEVTQTEQELNDLNKELDETHNSLNN